MRRADFLTMIGNPVRIVVTLRTGQQRSHRWFEFRSAMFGMTRDTTDTSGHVWLDYGRNKGRSVVTRRTIPVHATGEGMTTGAGVCVSL